MSLAIGRTVFAACGALSLAGIWLGPLPDVAAHSFSAHMAMHMGVVAVGTPLLALGLAGGRFDPVRLRPALFPPIPISLLELAVVWAWHMPALHDAARHSSLGLVLEQGSFAASGLLVWLSAFGGTPPAIRRRAAGLVALLLTSMHMTLLGALLALAPRPLYPHHGWPEGRTPLADQHLGGAIMLVVGGIAYLAGGLGLATRLLLPGRARGLRP